MRSGVFFGSPGFKFFLIAGLVLALLIPMVFVWFIIDEREDRTRDVRKEVAREWGHSQTITGPFLYVPYTTVVTSTEKDGEREEQVREHHAVFLLELRSARQVHSVQYVFVSLAMVFFYVLLLSLAEHMGFVLAYLIASGATGGMLSLYVARVQKSRVEGLIMLAVFAVLYGLLYLLLRLEEYALLAGAITGFLLLVLAMFSTLLRVEWSGRDKPAPG